MYSPALIGCSVSPIACPTAGHTYLVAIALKRPASGNKHASVTARLALEEVASAGNRDIPDILHGRARLLGYKQETAGQAG